MKEHNIKLTSAELGSLWASYMTESSTLPVLKYFKEKVEDKEILPVIEKAIGLSEQHLADLSTLFQQENYPAPVGFSDEDVHLNAPRLYSDTYMLYYLRNFGKAGIASDGMAFSMAARKDIRDLYKSYMDEAADLEDKAKEVMLFKGVFVRPPYISTPSRVDFIEKQSFLRGWLGERRTLSAEEIAHIFMNYTNCAYSKSLVMGFAQVTKDDRLKKHFIRSMEIKRGSIEILHTLLEESSLPSPMTWDTDVTDSTVAPFSDKLMLFQASTANAICIGNFGGSLALSLRRDLIAKYTKLIKDFGLVAEGGAELLISNGWFERPPQAMDREQLTKRK